MARPIKNASVGSILIIGSLIWEFVVSWNPLVSVLFDVGWILSLVSLAIAGFAHLMLLTEDKPPSDARYGISTFDEPKEENGDCEDKSLGTD